jgi:4-amino-4-deoxy-L-arabinose transferase-like glycosyltransferase
MPIVLQPTIREEPELDFGLENLDWKALMENLASIYNQLTKQLRISPRNRQADLLWLIFWTISALFLYTWQLGNVALRDWDEGIVAIVAREISRSSVADLTWLFPKYLGGAAYLNKPPLMHGLIALMYRVFGVSEWTTRFPGATLSALSVPLLFTLTRELFHQRLPAILAAGVYLTYLPMVRQGRLAMLDGAIVCFFLLMLNCLLRSRRDLRWSLGIGIGIGLMCLTKGLLGVLLGAIGLLFLLWDTRRILRSGYFWWGLALGALPVLVWYGSQVWHYGWGYIQIHFLDQAIDRVAQSVEKNGQPVWFYLWELFKYGAIWLVFLPLGIRLGWRDRNLSWVRLISIWLGGYLTIISAMQTKLPWYAMPLYPGISIVIAVALTHLWSPPFKFVQQTIWLPYRKVWLSIFSILLLVGVGGLVYYTRIAFAGDLALVCLLLTLTIFSTLVLVARHDRQFILVLIWGTYLTLFALVSSKHWNWELAEQYPVKPVAAFVAQYSPTQQAIYTTSPLFRPSLDFYSDRPVIPTTWAVLQEKTQRGEAWIALVPESEVSPDQFKGIKTLGQMPGWVMLGSKSGRSNG